MHRGRVDGVAQIVSRTVGDVDEIVPVPPEDAVERADALQVGPLAVRTDEVGLPRHTTVEDRPDGVIVVVDVDPVADVLSGAVEPRRLAVEQAGDLPGQELLRVLTRPVIVRAVRDRRTQTVAAHEGAHQVVGGRLGRRVHRRRRVGRVHREAVLRPRFPGPAQRQIPEDLIGGDVVQVDTVTHTGLGEHRSALGVGAHEPQRVPQGVVVVTLRREMDDSSVRSVPGAFTKGRHETVDQGGVRHGPLDEIDTGPGEIRRIRGVGHGVEHGDVHVGTRRQRAVDEVGTDETGPAGHQQAGDPAGPVERGRHQGRYQFSPA